MNLRLYLKQFVFFILALPVIDCHAQNADSVARLFPQYKSNAPGYAIGISRSGKLVYQHYTGLANVSYNVPLGSNSVFNVGSVSKQFTATCIALLQFQGRLSVNDPITKYLPEFPRVYRQIKISNLIYHTAGVRSWEMLEMLGGRSSEKGYYTSDMILDMLKAQKGLNFKPGEKYLYSNGGYILLAEIIRRTTGKSLKDFADANIFKPLGMNQTFFVDDQQQLYNHKVTGYRRNDDGSLYEVIDHNNSYGSGNLHTTIGDLAKWEYNYSNNRLGFGNELIKLLLTEGKLNDGSQVGYGFGVELERYDGYKVISHTGYWPGFRTRMLVIPDLAYAVTFITNSSDDIHSDRTAFDIADAYSPELFKKRQSNSSSANNRQPAVKSNPFKSSPAQQATLKGIYYCPELNKAFGVIPYKGSLALQIDDDTLQLKQTGRFTYSFQDGMILSFSDNASHTLTSFSLDVGEELKGLYFKKIK